MTRTKLTVEGWTCDGCLNATLRVTKKVDGVAEARGDLEARQVELEFDGRPETLENVREAIARAGYEVTGTDTP